MGLNRNEIVVPLIEATKRVSSTQTLIFTDRTPKSLYEYFLNKYTIEDIQKIIENIKIEFDAWDKMYNLYRSSNQLMELSNAEVAVLYEDSQGNQFIYSTATRRVYYYNKDVPPYINLSEGLTIQGFLDIAKRDFEALLRTPYGKKYVAESSVVTEGIKEYFGYGKALRIFIDGKVNKNQQAFDKHSFAFIDALLHYSKSMIAPNVFDTMMGRKTHVLEVYENTKLGRRDGLRRMTPDQNVLIETSKVSLEDAMQQFDQDPQHIYSMYYSIMKGLECFVAAKPGIKKVIDKNALKTTVGYFSTYGHFKLGNYDTYINEFINDPMLITGGTLGSSIPIIAFSESDYHTSLIAHMNNRLERFSNKDIHAKFEYLMQSICNVLHASDKTNVWKFYFFFNRDKHSCESDNDAICMIYGTTSQFAENQYAPEVPEAQKMTSGKDYKLGVINNILFEYLMYGESSDYSDEYVRYIVDETVNRPQVLENTLTYVIEEREVGRQISHTARDLKEKILSGLTNATRDVRMTLGNISEKIQDTMDDMKKNQEEEDREIAITDSTFLKLRRYFKQVLALSFAAWYLVGPCAAIATFIFTNAMKSDDKKAKESAIRELELELKLTREKIEDSRSDNARKEKYALLRLESKIEDNIAKLKYGMK